MAGPTAYDVSGTGPPLVLIHGLGLNRQLWRWQLDELMPHFSVLRYDLLGHGESAHPPGPYHMSQMVAQLDGLLAHSRVQGAAIVGFSLGGLIAQAFTLAHPGKVSALAILNSAHARTDEQRNSIMLRVRQAEESGPAATVDAALERWFTPGFAERKPDVLEQVRAWVVANDPEVYPAVYRLLANADTGLATSIAAIACPALVMTGEDDSGNSPQMAQQMAAIMPHARLEILPGLRHMALVESPAVVNALLLSFLQEALTGDSAWH